MEKGANGTDSRFSSAKAKKEQAYVVSLVNEGGRTLFKQVCLPNPGMCACLRSRPEAHSKMESFII